MIMLGVSRVLCVLAGIALITLVAFQTTKSEGLSGTIGGKVSSSFSRGRLGKEEQLAVYTKWAAIAFMVLAFITYLLQAAASRV